MTEQDTTHPREDDRNDEMNDEIDEDPAPDPTDVEQPSGDDPGAD